MKLPSPGFLLNAFFQASRRFPGAMLCAIAGVVTVIAYISPNGGAEERYLERLWMVFQLGLPFLTGLVAFSESKAWDEKRGWLLQGLGLLVLAGCWVLFDPSAPAFEYVGLPRYFVLVVTAHLFVAAAPYLNQLSVRDFWEYNRELFANIIIGVVFTLILFAGLGLAILAVDQLFDLNIDHKIYGKLFVVLAGVFNTTYFLFHFPEKYEFASADTGYNAIFKNLCKFILIPIVGLYFLILYTYGGKILAMWSLPRGWVSSLVLGFSVAGIFTYLLNFYLPEHDDSAHVRGYKKWFWWVVLPPTVLLFVAIGKRISDYGVTEERFLVAHLGVWLAATCLYFLFSKHDNIKFIPISLGLFALVFAFGPLSAFKVSERSQVGILKNLLEKNGRWKEGRMVQGTSPVPKEEVWQIISALEFLERRDALSHLTWLPMPVDSFMATNPYGTYGVAGRIAAWAGVDVNEARADTYLNIGVGDFQFAEVDVRGFSTFYKVALDTGADKDPASDGNFFKLSDDGKRVEWEKTKTGKARLVETFDLQPILSKWTTQAQNYYLHLSQSEATFDLVGKKGTLRIIVQNASVDKSSSIAKLNYLEGFLFLKEK